MSYRYRMHAAGPGVNVSAHSDVESGIAFVGVAAVAAVVVIADDGGVVGEGKQWRGVHGILRTWRRLIRRSLGMRS